MSGVFDDPKRYESPNWKPNWEEAQWTHPEWPELEPLAAGELPDFPIVALPTPMADFVREKSRAMQVPAALVALPVLSVCAAAVMKKFRVKVREDFEVPLNVYTAVVMDSGDRKSPVFDAGLEPLKAYERRLLEETAGRISETRTHLKLLEGRLAHLKRAIPKAKTPKEREEMTAEAKAIGREISQTIPPADPRLIVDNTTPERVEMHLAEQGGRMAVMSAEGTPFDIAAGLYTNGQANADVYLKAWGGDDLRVDRVGRATIYVEKPAITLGVMIQPDALATIRANRAFRGRGLLNRILYAVPRSLAGYRQTNPPPDPVPYRVQRAYEETVARLLELEGAERVITLAPDAHGVFMGAETEIEPMFRPDGRLGGRMKGWGSKLAGELARIAGVLHLVRHPEDPLRPIEKETMLRALALMEFFVAHAVAAFDDLGLFPRTELARRILEWVRWKGLLELSRSELHHDNEHLVGRPEEWEDPLDLLIEKGYLRRKEPPPRKATGGRPPSQVYLVNPDVHMEGGATA